MTPDQLAKSGSEHSHQVALFAWCNMAALYGVTIADDDAAYTIPNWAKKTHKLMLDDTLKYTMTTDLLFQPIPELSLLFAIHNQGHGDKIRGSIAKAEGVKAGVPDLFLPVPKFQQMVGIIECHYHGLFIELKKQNEGKVSEEQKKWLEHLTEQGYKTEVCFGWKSARNALLYYLGKI